MERMLALVRDVMPDFMVTDGALRYEAFKYNRLVHGRNGHGKPLVAKSICHDIFPEHPEISPEVIYRDLIGYYDKLKKIGVPVSEIHTVAKEGDLIVEVMENTGVEMGKALAACGTSHGKEEVVRKIIESITPVLLHGEKEGVGIDPGLDNSGIYEGRITYHDFVPSRFVNADGHAIVGIPQPPPEDPMAKYLYHRYYTLRGIARRLWFALARCNHSFHFVEKIFWQILQEKLDSGTFRELKEHFDDLPYNKIRVSLEKKHFGEVAKIIEGLNMFQVDDLREVSTLIVNPEDLQVIFRSTGIDLFRSAEEREAGFQEAKEFLLKKMNS